MSHSTPRSRPPRTRGGLPDARVFTGWAVLPLTRGSTLVSKPAGRPPRYEVCPIRKEVPFGSWGKEAPRRQGIPHHPNETRKDGRSSASACPAHRVCLRDDWPPATSKYSSPYTRGFAGISLPLCVSIYVLPTRGVCRAHLACHLLSSLNRPCSRGHRLPTRGFAIGLAVGL